MAACTWPTVRIKLNKTISFHLKVKSSPAQILLPKLNPEEGVANELLQVDNSPPMPVKELVADKP